jgi:hypothetical protein
LQKPVSEQKSAHRLVHRHRRFAVCHTVYLMGLRVQDVKVQFLLDT